MDLIREEMRLETKDGAPHFLFRRIYEAHDGGPPVFAVREVEDIDKATALDFVAMRKQMDAAVNAMDRESA